MGEGFDNRSSHFNIHSVLPSPIVEMPPSPAPSQMGVVEYPADDDVYEYDEDEYVVEVRTMIFIHTSLTFCELTISSNKKKSSRD